MTLEIEAEKPLLQNDRRITDESWSYDRDGKITVGPDLFLDDLPGTLEISGFGKNIKWIPAILAERLTWSDLDLQSYYRELRDRYVGCVVPFQSLLNIHESFGGLTSQHIQELIDQKLAQDLFVNTAIGLEGTYKQYTIVVKSRRGRGISPDILRLNLRSMGGKPDIEPVITEALLHCKVGERIWLNPLMRHGQRKELYIIPEETNASYGWVNSLNIKDVMPDLNTLDGFKKMSGFGGVDKVKIVIGNEKVSAKTGYVVRATGITDGRVSPRFGVIHQGVFYPDAGVSIMPRLIESAESASQKFTFADAMRPSVFGVQWVGTPANAKDIMYAELLQNKEGQVLLHICRGTDVGVYRNGVLIHIPLVQPIMPGGKDRPEDVSDVKKPVEEKTLRLEEKYPNLYYLAKLWHVTLPQSSMQGSRARKNPFSL